MTKTTKEYNTGKLRIVETRTEICVSESVRRNVLGLRRHSWETETEPMVYVSVTLAYHLLDGRCIEGKYIFELDNGEQWQLYLPGAKPLKFPKQSKMTEYVRKHFA